jgi:hypothetical protein
LNLTQYFPPQRIRHSGSVLLALLALTLSSGPTGFAQTASDHKTAPPQRVLMLFNEGRDVPGNIILEQAVRAEMLRADTNRIEFFAEHLDASHFADEEHFRLFQDYLGKKYADQPPDLILAFPSRNYRIAGELPQAVFPNVPVVFVAVNELAVPSAISKLGITGIVQRFDLRGTLGLIMRLQPDTRRIVVISGISDVDRATLNRRCR